VSYLREPTSRHADRAGELLSGPEDGDDDEDEDPLSASSTSGESSAGGGSGGRSQRSADSPSPKLTRSNSIRVCDSALHRGAHLGSPAFRRRKMRSRRFENPL